ncbi:hypothetical protein Vafri_1896, partial [Volvox africanus]
MIKFAALVVLFAAVASRPANAASTHPDHDSAFKHGVSCRQPTAKSSFIFTLVHLEPISGDVGSANKTIVEWQVATDKSFDADTIVASGESVAPLVKSGYLRPSALVKGLTPDQHYFYRFKVLPDGPVSPTGTFHTPSAREGDQTGEKSAIATAAAVSKRLKIRSDASLDRKRRQLSGATVAGTLGHTLSADKATIRTAEAPIGNFVCDAMKWFVEEVEGLVPDFCLVNSGAIRADLPAGAVTFDQIEAALPYKNNVLVQIITGLGLITALENSVNGNFATNELRGAFLQVAGFRFAFNPLAPPQQRVTNVEIEVGDSYAPIDPCTFYLLVTNDYLAGGGDGYSSIKASQDVLDIGQMVEAVELFLGARSPVTGYAAPEGRIIRCDTTPSAICTAAIDPSASHCAASFRLLHYSDVHSRVEAATSAAAPCSEAQEEQGICYGGFARMATYINSVREAVPNVLLLDGGDMSVGTIWDLVYRDRKPSAAFQNSIGVDAFTLGDHEFDFGVEELVAYLKGLNMPIVSCNVITDRFPSLTPLIKPYAIVEIGGSGVKAAIIGYITPSTANTSLGGKQVDFEPLIVPSVKKAIQQVKDDYGDQINIFIGLSHAGLWYDIQVAQEVPELDFIVGGLNHYFFWSDGKTLGPRLDASNPSSSQKPDQPYPLVVDSKVVPGKKIPIVQAYYASRYIGSMDLSFDADGNLVSFSGAPVLLGGSVSSNPVARDPETLNLIQGFAESVHDLSGQRIGERGLVRSGESALGNLICDSMIWYLKETTNLAPADACLLNGGLIRANLSADYVTLGDILNVPFANTMTLLSITGAQLVAALENAVSGNLMTENVTQLQDRMAQVSGFTFMYDETKPVGTRVLSVSMLKGNGSHVPVDPCQAYSLVTTDFVAAGLDGYTVLASAPRLLETGVPIEMVLSEYGKYLSLLPSCIECRIIRCSDNPAICPIVRNVTAYCLPPPPP